MILGLKRCLPGSMDDDRGGFCFLDPKKQRNNDVFPEEINRSVVNSGFQGAGGFLARKPQDSGFPKTANPSRVECDSESGFSKTHDPSIVEFTGILDSKSLGFQESVMPERVEVVCNETEGVYFPGLHMVQCGCKSCVVKQKNTKKSVGDWEKHAGSRAKKWKVSIKLKATKKPLGEWVAEYSASINPELDPHRLSAFLSQEYQPVIKKWTAERCAICRWIEDWEYNKIIICNKCEIAVHQECYGVSHIKDFTHWVCNSCENPNIKTECCLCPVKCGALKPCEDKPFWVHVICAWFQPEISFLNHDKMEPAVGLMRVPITSFQQTCQICNQIHGSCVQCCKCSKNYHTTCAFQAGFRMELVLIPNKNGRNMNRMILYCDIHKPPDANSKLVIRTLENKIRNQEKQQRVLKSSHLYEPEPQPDQFSAARCRVYVRSTAKKRVEIDPVINTRLNYNKGAEKSHGFFLSMPERLNHLQRTIKDRICLGKSGIHGWGVFARRNLREGEVVAEYLGEILRRSVADVREARYKATGRDCYLFSISEEVVIDATMKGSLARLFNHSCMPNCYSRIVNLKENDYRVVLMAKKDVGAGEELTFDYMFDRNEDYEPTAPCFCGAPNCRKFM